MFNVKSQENGHLDSVLSFTEISSSYVTVETYRKTVSSSPNRKINQCEIDYKNEHDFFPFGNWMMWNENVLSVDDVGFNQLCPPFIYHFCVNMCRLPIHRLPMSVCIFGALYSFHSLRITIWTNFGYPNINDVVNGKDDDFRYFFFQ